MITEYRDVSMTCHLPAYNEVSVTCTTAKGCGTWLTKDTSCTRDTCTSGTSVRVQREWKPLKTITESSLLIANVVFIVLLLFEANAHRYVTGMGKRGELGREKRPSALLSLLSSFFLYRSRASRIMFSLGTFCWPELLRWGANLFKDQVVGLRISTSMIHTLKIEKICFSPKVSIQPCWPKSDSALPGAISAQSGPKKLHQKAISAQGRAHFSPS